MQEEIWKVVEGYPNYKISNKGKVLNIKTGKFLTLSVSNTGYKCLRLIKNKKTKSFKLARLLGFHFLGLKEFEIIDHIDGNRLNDSLDNLRRCTLAQNNRNIRKHRDGKSSKYKGVSFDKKAKRFIAKITLDKVVYRKGFKEEVEAALQYNKWALELHKEFARINCL